MSSAPKKLYRSRSDRVLGGVAGGLGEYFNVDPNIVRIVFLLLAIGSMGFGIIFYLVLVFILPQEIGPDTHVNRAEKIKEVGKKIGEGVQFVASEIKEKVESRPKTDRRTGFRNALGLLLILFGTIFVVREIFPEYRFAWHFFWPVVLILLGLYAIFSGERKP